MGVFNTFIKRARTKPVETTSLSTSTTKVFFDISIDNQPAGRLVFKLYDDLHWAQPYASKFIEIATRQQDKLDPFYSFIGSEFQRCGTGRGDGVAFSTRGKSEVDLFELRKMWDFMMYEYPYTHDVKGDNPLTHDREGLLTAITTVPERYLRKSDFMRQLISQPNKHAETMFGIIYEPYELLDGRFQVIGEIIEGWDALIELECACVQPISYYYPNNQHLIALAEQTGMDRDPRLLERIALGLQTDTYLPGMIEAQLAIDSRDEVSDAESCKEQKNSHDYTGPENKGKNVIKVPKISREEALKNIPLAVRPAFESAESAEIKEREKWEAWDAKGKLDIVSMNKFQPFMKMENKHELINNPSIGPGPMTASATITKSGIIGTERKFISASLKNFLTA